MQLSNINNNNLSLSINPVTVYLSSLSEGSRRTTIGSLKVITQVSGYGDDILNYPWHELRYQHVQAIRTHLADKYHHTTANKILSLLKGVLKECKRLDLMSVTDYDKATDIKVVKGTSIQAGRHITNEEFERLIAVCDSEDTLLSRRNKAIFYCLQVGLRRSEISNLKLADYDKQEHQLTVRKAKGNKSRIVPLTAKGIVAFNEYLELSAHTTGHLIVTVDRDRRKLDDEAIYNVVKKIAKEARVENTGAHDFRRSCASNLLEKGADLVVVQKILGHESVETTARYDRRGIEAQKKAINLL